MQSNPYAGLVALMRGQGGDNNPAGDSAQAGIGAAPVRMRLGTVVSAAPLKVRVAGLVQPPSALRLNERLAKGAWDFANDVPIFRGGRPVVVTEKEALDAVT